MVTTQSQTSTKTAAETLKRPLPSLVDSVIRGERTLPQQPWKVDPSRLHIWHNFPQQAAAFIATCEPLRNTIVPSFENSGSLPDMHTVGSESSVRTKWMQHVLTPLNAVFDALACEGGKTVGKSINFHSLSLSHETDVHTGCVFVRGNYGREGRWADRRVVVVGEVEVSSRLPLRSWFTDGEINYWGRRVLLAPVGRLVASMWEIGLKYGFLANYKEMVFVQRTDDYNYSLSVPLLIDGTSPSIQEAMFYFVHSLYRDDVWYDSGHLDMRQVLTYNPTGEDPGTTTTAVEECDLEESPFDLSQLTDRSVVVRTQNATAVVECGEELSKKAYKATWNGRPVVLKFWDPRDPDWGTIRDWAAYELYAREILGTKYIPPILLSGRIILANGPTGRCIVMDVAPGETLTWTLWDKMNACERAAFKKALAAAFAYFREKGVIHDDARKANVVWCRRTNSLSVIDWELYSTREWDRMEDGQKQIDPEKFEIRDIMSGFE